MLYALLDPDICSPGGGCVLPVFAKQKRGKDCTSIFGALDVSCIDSTCVVHACKDGFVVSDDESTCLPGLTLESRDTAAADDIAGNTFFYASDLASSVKAVSTSATQVVPRGATSTSILSLGPADTVINLDHENLGAILGAKDPFTVLVDAYTAAREHSKRETDPPPIIPSTVYPATGMGGLVLVESL